MSLHAIMLWGSLPISYKELICEYRQWFSLSSVSSRIEGVHTNICTLHRDAANPNTQLALRFSIPADWT